MWSGSFSTASPTLFGTRGNGRSEVCRLVSRPPHSPPASSVSRAPCLRVASYCCGRLAGLPSSTLSKSYTKVAVQCTAPRVAKVTQFFPASSGGSGIPYVLRQAHGSGIPNGITKARMCVHSGIHMCFIRHILCHRSVMELQIPERAVMFFARHKVLAFVMASVYSLTDAWFWHPYVLHQACSLSVLHQ